MRAGIHIAPDCLAPAHHEAGEQGLARTESEALGAGIGDVGQGAQTLASTWPGRISGIGLQVLTTSMRNGRISTRSNRPALT